MSDSTLRIGVVAPEVLGTYGDGGNALILAARAKMRGIAAEIVEIPLFEPIPTELDIYTLGGGEDGAQSLAADHLRAERGLFTAASANKPILAICASLQILGRHYTDAQGREVAGLGLLDLETVPMQTRAIGEVVADPMIEELTEPLTGFENHGGKTMLGADARPLGQVIAGLGNGSAGTEGAVQGSVLATYMHGPVLVRNPQLADLVLQRALGTPLEPLEISAVEVLRAERLAAAIAG